MSDAPRTVRTADGWNLHVEVVPAAGERHATAVLAHAMFCNRRTLDKPAGQGLASVLSASGVECWVADLRGHSDSGPRAPEGAWSYDDFIVHDLPALIREAAGAHGGAVALVGHSLAGHAAVAAAAIEPDLPVTGIVSLGGNVWLPSLEPSRAMWAFKRASLEAWGQVAARVGYFPARRLGLGSEDEAADYVQQFVSNARRDRWASFDGRTDYLAALADLRAPVLSVTSTADRWMCRPVAARQWLAFAASATVTHRVVGNEHEDPTTIDHMGLVLSPRMRPIWREIAAWIASRG